MSVFVIILLPCISCNASLNFIYYVEGTMNIISLMTFPNIENQGEMNAVFYIMKQLIQKLYVSSADIYVDRMFLSTANCNNTRPTFLHSNLAVIYTNKSFICITFNTQHQFYAQNAPFALANCNEMPIYRRLQLIKCC